MAASSTTTTATTTGVELPMPEADFQELKNLLDADETVGAYSKAFFERDLWGYTEYLSRFYVARGGSVQPVFRMVRDSFVFRQQYNADTILDASLWAETNPTMELMQRYWPGRFLGKDKRGMPVWIERFGHTDPSSLMDRVPAEDLIHFHLWVQEEGTRLLRQSNNELPADQQHIVLRNLAIEDLDGLGMKHYHSKALDVFRQCIKLDEANYPERLGRLYVINAPTVFRLLWGVVKPWLDPRTLKKIEILGGDYREKLLELIDEDQLPVGLGGTLDVPLPANTEPFDDTLPSGLPLNSKKVTVDRRGQTAVAFRVEAVSTLSWEFTCEGYDIAMGILNTANDQWICAVERFESHISATTGSLEMQPGAYNFVFDNSFSRFTSKSVQFRLSLR